MRQNNEKIKDILYEWAHKLDKEVFKNHISHIIKKYYEPNTSQHLHHWIDPATGSSKRFNFSHSTRRSYIFHYFKEKFDNVKILALIFSQGRITSTSLNYLICAHLLADIQEDIRNNPQKFQDPYYNILLHTQVDNNLLSSLQEDAKERLKNDLDNEQNIETMFEYNHN